MIFITENDVMKAGLPIYHIDRVVRETGKLFEDEEHIIYVNSQIKDETKLGRLMHDFSCTDAKDMYNKVLADRVRYFKEDERGVEIMCREMGGQILQILRTVAVYGILSHVSTPSFYRRASPMRTVIFSFSSMRLMATYVSMSSTLKMFWLLSTKVVPPPCADIKARDCSAV